MSDDDDDIAFVDGVLATMDNQGIARSQGTSSGKKKKSMSEEQKSHILKVRKVVETTHDMRAYDWRNIFFPAQEGWSSPHRYYVKPSAVWIPHLIRRGFHPYCPNCKKPVPTIDYRWVDQPMVLFGLTGHCYLDTIRYKCACCEKSFRATNMDSMSLDKLDLSRQHSRYIC